MSQAKCWIFVLALSPWLAGCGGDERSPDVAHQNAHDDHGTQGGDTTEVTSETTGHQESGQHAESGSHDAHGSHDGDHATTSAESNAKIDAGHGGHGSHGEHALAEQPLPAGAKRPAAVQPKVKVKFGEGATAFSIKWKDDGAKMVDSNEQEIARFNHSGDKVKIKDAKDKVLAYLVGRPSQGRVKVEDATQENELFKFIRQEDGDWKLEDASDNLLVRVKKRDYGAELESADDASLFKVKVKDGKTSLRNAKDQTVYYTNTPIAPFGFACLGFEAIEDLRIRVALAAYLQMDDGHHH